MENNNSSGDGQFVWQVTYRFFIVQILVTVCIFVNLLLLITFFKKYCFHSVARYNLFALTLIADSFLLFMSNVLFIQNYFRSTINVSLCITITVFIVLYFQVTPVTLTAMTLERYVAICNPLHHAELCSPRRVMYCILVIHGIGSIPCVVIFSACFAVAPAAFYREHNRCSVQTFIFYRWQTDLRSGISQVFFIVMCIIIIRCYVKIMKVAKLASGENKQSTAKGLRTVTLHAFQLLFCLMQLWCPFIEAAVLQIDLMLFKHVRYFNYIMFSIFPRCLSPLVYGLRDEAFFNALKNVFGFGVRKNINQIIFH